MEFRKCSIAGIPYGAVPEGAGEEKKQLEVSILL